MRGQRAPLAAVIAGALVTGGLLGMRTRELEHRSSAVELLRQPPHELALGWALTAGRADDRLWIERAAPYVSGDAQRIALLLALSKGAALPAGVRAYVELRAQRGNDVERRLAELVLERDRAASGARERGR